MLSAPLVLEELFSMPDELLSALEGTLSESGRLVPVLEAVVLEELLNCGGAELLLDCEGVAELLLDCGVELLSGGGVLLSGGISLLSGSVGLLSGGTSLLSGVVSLLSGGAVLSGGSVLSAGSLSCAGGASGVLPSIYVISAV